MEFRQVVHAGETPLQQAAPGTSRRILCYDDKMMAVEVHCEKDGGGAPHQHPHSQVSYVLSGRFRYMVEEQAYILAPGDSVVVPPNAFHGCVCLEKGVLLDVFTPLREDFIK